MFRDLRALREAGYTVTYDAEHNTYAGSTGLNDVLTDPSGVEELVCMAAASVLPLPKTVRESAYDAAEKLTALLPESSQSRIKRLTSYASIVDKVNRDATREFQVVNTAMQEGRCIEVLSPLPDDSTVDWNPVQVHQLVFELPAGWTVIGMLTRSHQKCSIVLNKTRGLRLSRLPASNVDLPKLLDRQVDYRIE